MPRFEIGQKVRATRNYDGKLTAGNIYLIVHHGSWSEDANCVIADDGRVDGWSFESGDFGRYIFEAIDDTVKEPAASDPVVRPHHYARFVIEPITFINANGLPYNIGNVVKYACRYDAKNGVEDLRKARRYLDIHIETLERQARVAAGESAADVWKGAL